jgi:hypothetical protein
MEQCKQKAISNIELEKRKQANSNKKETPEQYTARKELQAQKVVKKETHEQYIIRKELQAQKVVKKETPEEYKARKESQAQRKVKKETPEEYATRIEYIKKKEEVELKLETQRLFEKAEKQHQNHLNYLSRQNEKAKREEVREEIRIANERDKAEREKYKADQAERFRIWYSREASWVREQERKDFEKIPRDYEKEEKQRIEDYKRTNKGGGGGGRYGRGSGSGMGLGGSRVYEPRVGGGPVNVEGN